MRSALKKIVYPLLNKWYQNKTNKTQKYQKFGIALDIFPDVFHPGVFLSTNIFIRFLKTKTLENKRVLELGAGSGMISFFCAKQRASVTATDINENALEGLKSNSQRTEIPIKIIASNLFENVHPNDFDLIVVNPPYYPKNPKNQKESAFYCGTNFEYFHSFFAQIDSKMNQTVEILMILSEDCDILKIKEIAKNHGFELRIVHETKKRLERNYIFEIVAN